MYLHLKNYEIYIDELKKWNRSINLVDSKSLDDGIQRHVIDSQQLANYFDISNENIVDIGSGAGFPGMVLAIEGAKFVRLVEPVFKKVAFLEHIKNIYKIDVMINNCTWQQLQSHDATLVVSRAFAPLKELLMAMSCVSRETIDPKGFFLKGEKLHAEIIEAQHDWSFNYETFESATHAKGKIVKVWDVKKNDS